MSSREFWLFSFGVCRVRCPSAESTEVTRRRQGYGVASGQNAAEEAITQIAQMLEPMLNVVRGSINKISVDECA